MFWRYTGYEKVYDLCKQISLPDGVLISHDFDRAVKYVAQATFRQKCFEGSTPMLNTNINLVMNTFSQPLPVVKASWSEYTLQPNDGVFVYSVVPIVYSISILAVITWFLTLFVITNYTIKPSLVLRASAFLSSAYMLITVVKSIVILNAQQRQGYLHGEALLEHINLLTYLNAIDMVTTLLLQINQVQVVMRLFLRQSDKRLIFFVGVLASAASQTLWCLSKFHSFEGQEEAGQIIRAFTYLIRIATSISYAAIFTAFVSTKIKTIAAHRNIWAITLLTLVFIYAPVAFFVADVSSTWVYELSEVFSVVTYVICVVIPWEWCNKYNVIRKIKEKEGVLGRRFHEDELYELDRFELFVEEEDDDASDTNHTSSDGTRHGSSSDDTGHGFSTKTRNSEVLDMAKFETEAARPTGMARFSNGLFKVRNRFLDITDKIIATGLAIPRSVSVGSAHTPAFHFDRRPHEHSIGTDRPRTVAFEDEQHTRNGRDVFVYSTRDVVINIDD